MFSTNKQSAKTVGNKRSLDESKHAFISGEMTRHSNFLCKKYQNILKDIFTVSFQKPSQKYIDAKNVIRNSIGSFRCKTIIV